MTGDWLAYCSACPFRRSPMSSPAPASHSIRSPATSTIPRPGRDPRMAGCRAKVRSTLRDSNLGLLGHYYSGMLDVATDITQIAITFGCHIEMLEVDELSALRDTYSRRADRLARPRLPRALRHSAGLLGGGVGRAARTSVALDHFVEQHDLAASPTTTRAAAIRQRRHDEFHHPRHITAHRAPHSRRRRVRSQERASR